MAGRVSEIVAICCGKMHSKHFDAVQRLTMRRLYHAPMYSHQRQIKA